MTIKTNHEVYDDIFFLSNNKSCKSKIQGIKIEVTSCPQEIDTKIIYLCNNEEDARVHIKVEEQHAFKSKEDLLKSL